MLSPGDFQDIIAYVREHRTTSEPFDVVASGFTQGGGGQADVDAVAPFVEAGATWWFELTFPWATPLEELRARIEKGPPRVPAGAAARSDAPPDARFTLPPMR